MSTFEIRGGKRLSGKVRVSGNKNSIYGLISASLLADSPVVLENVPDIRDIDVMLAIIKDLGCRVKYNKKSVLEIDPTSISHPKLNINLVGKIRGSIVLIAPLLAKFGEAEIARLGGDLIGERAVDTHLNMLSSFGVDIEGENTHFLKARNLKSGYIFLEEASVTATEIALILASFIDGETEIYDAASEPHIVDLANLLTKMGVKIKGAGTNRIYVQGRKKLRGTEHKIRPDHIEVGTFAIASAITSGQIVIEDVLAEDLEMILLYLKAMGVEFKFIDKQRLAVYPSKLHAYRKKFQTRPWPGFPTDLMSLFIVLATQTQGTVLCHDWMYESRMFFVDRLIRMGAEIIIADPHRVIVNGPTQLHADILPSPDIRAGSALVLAALVAQGKSVVEHAEIIDRGYERLDERLAALGADIRRID